MSHYLGKYRSKSEQFKHFRGMESNDVFEIFRKSTAHKPSLFLLIIPLKSSVDIFIMKILEQRLCYFKTAKHTMKFEY